MPGGKQHHALQRRQTNKEGEKKQANFLHFNAPRIVRNLYNQGNYRCGGSTYKKSLGSCGRDWEGYEIENKETEYFRGL